MGTGLSKKRKKSRERNKAHASNKRTKHKEPATEKVYSEADSVASNAETVSAHESAGHDTGSDSGSADLSSAVGGVVKDTQTETDQRARVEDAPDIVTDPTDTVHEETTPQQSLVQDPPRTPRNQPSTVAGLLTPPQSRLRSTIHSLGARSEQDTPISSVANPLAGAERLPKILSAPLPRASTPARPQPSREEQAASRPRSDEFPPQIVQSTGGNTPADGLYRAKVAFNKSQAQLKEADDRLRSIKADQDQIDSRLFHCEALLAPPATNTPEVRQALQAVAVEMAIPYEILLAQKEKVDAMRSEASRLCKEKQSLVKLWTVVNAWVRSQPQCSSGGTTAGGEGDMGGV